MLKLETLMSLAPDKPFVIKNARLFDGQVEQAETDTVVVQNGRITAMGTASTVTVPQEAEMIDASGYTLLPGLIDCHVHLMADGEPDLEKVLTKEHGAFLAIKATRTAARSLVAGFTTVRDMGNNFYIGVSLRQAINQGLVPGPHIVSAGAILSITGGHGDSHFCPHIHVEAPNVVDGPEEVRKQVRRDLKYGVDWIKMCATGGVLSEGDEPGAPQFSIEEMKAAVEEATRAGKRVATHAIGTTGIKNALRAGVHSIEHGHMVDDEGIELLKQRKVCIVPTLAAPHNIMQAGSAAGIPDYVMRKASDLSQLLYANLRHAYNEGVQFAMGTDAGTPFNFHGNNALELELMLELGMSNLEVLAATTSVAATNIGVEQDRGSLAVGKRADLLLVEGNPLANLKLLQDKEKLAVFQSGKLVAQGGKLL